MPDILIQGMEMPAKGYKTIILHSNGRVYEPTSEELIVNKIADATELPPHGDLIDRDAMLKSSREDRLMWVYDLTDLPEFAADLPVIVPSEKGETQ